MNEEQKFQVSNRVALAQKLMQEAVQIEAGETIAEMDDAQKFALLVGHMLKPIKVSLETLTDQVLETNQEQKSNAKAIEELTDRIARVELHCFGRTYGGESSGGAESKRDPEH